MRQPDRTHHPAVPLAQPHPPPVDPAGVLLVLGLLCFWGMSTTPAVDVRETAMEARGVLQPLDAAPSRPGGGGIANMTTTTAPAAASAAAGAAVLPAADAVGGAAVAPTSADASKGSEPQNRTIGS